MSMHFLVASETMKDFPHITPQPMDKEEGRKRIILPKLTICGLSISRAYTILCF